MKQTTSMILPDPLSTRSIVNSVTEDEDDQVHNLNSWKEHVRPRGDFRLPPLLPAHIPSYPPGNATGYSQPLSQSHILPPMFKDANNHTSSLPPLQEPILDTQSYLIQYERMMNEQEIELSSTLSHLQPLFELLERLASPRDEYRRGKTAKTRMNLSKTFFTRNLSRALEILEEQDGYESVKADTQFMMTLRIFCDRESSLSGSVRENVTKHRNHVDEMVSLGEILQCYRMCIVGMQTLELLPSGSSARNRTKERTLQMLSLFRPSPSESLNSSPIHCESPHPTAKFSEKRSVQMAKQNEGRSFTLSFLFFLAFVAGALAVATVSHVVKPNASPTFGPQVPEQPVVLETPPLKDAAQNRTSVQDVALPVFAPRPSSNISFEGSVTMPVLIPIERLKRKSISIARINAFPVIPQEHLRKEVPFEKKNETAPENAFINHEAVTTFLGGTAAGLYLLAPIIAASPSWLTMGVTFLVTSLGGQTFREWVGKMKGIFSKSKMQEA
jgi:hypothetical protein